MAITKQQKNINEFIAAAPDAIKEKGIKRGNKRQISLTMAPDLLNRVDELAAQLGQTRAAVISMSVYMALDRGLTIDGLRKTCL